ncbi:uncharacterized protein LOC110983995 isoform X2 [Acanthaster planci]|uniref:Uncharacterized protein LOC110983995 isoform X2 n=1 Tax=Acanthaster planci TaxID=133434 RepID=A0A8B7Z1G7_ACAPL|nr:uncharacterized protein LOC110983995 isoform X2 [Acanthaster planci]
MILWRGGLKINELSKDVVSTNFRKKFVHLTHEGRLRRCRGRPALQLNDPGYKGCYWDEAEMRDSAFGRFVVRNNTMTVEKCLQICKRRNDSLAGLRQRDQCHCGNRISDKRRSRSDRQKCAFNCTGNERQFCGGHYPHENKTRMSVYNVSSSECPHPAIPAHGSVMETGDFWFGSEVTFRCDVGFELHGNRSVQCIQNKFGNVIWSQAIPGCLEVTSQQNGTVVGVSVSLSLFFILACGLFGVFVLKRRKLQSDETVASSGDIGQEPDRVGMKKDQSGISQAHANNTYGLTTRPSPYEVVELADDVEEAHLSTAAEGESYPRKGDGDDPVPIRERSDCADGDDLQEAGVGAGYRSRPLADSSLDVADEGGWVDNIIYETTDHEDKTCV